MEQLGFDALLTVAAETNAARTFAKETAHLPGGWTEALACHRDQISRHDAAMLDCDFEAAHVIRKEAHLLARKLNGNAPGILAGPDAPGCRLAQKFAAKPGDAPLWGQDGSFDIRLEGVVMRVEMNGMFGIGATAMPFLGFSVRAADKNEPFLSSTGYRSFLGASIPPQAGMTTADFVRRVVESHIAYEPHGKLVRISEQFR